MHRRPGVFLSRAASPRLQSNGRWLAVNASSRRAYVLPGKDEQSALLNWLAEGRDPAEQECVEAARRLGVEGDLPSSYSGADFTSWYRCLNYNYPFLDYGRGESHQADAELMSAYGEAEALLPPAHRAPASAWPYQMRS